MECLGSIDPYGCKIKPNGIQLVLCHEECRDGSPNLSKPLLQVWIDGAEAADGWSAPLDADGNDVCAWVRFIGPM